MAPLIGIFIFLVNIALFIAQSAAIGAGIHTWLGWDYGWAVGAAVIAIWFIPVPFVTGIAGILGAHYGWHWSWFASIALFAGPTLLVLGLQAMFMGGAKLAYSVQDAWRARQAPRTDTPLMKASPPEHRTQRLSVGMIVLCVAVGLGAYTLVKEMRQPTRSASTAKAASWATGLDPRLKPAIDRYQARVTSMPEFLAYAKSLPSGADPAVRGALLSSQGVLKLSTSDLERRAAINLLMLNSADTATCAKIARAQPADAPQLANAIYPLLANQAPSVIDEWFDLTYNATLASLKGLPEHRPSDQEIEPAIQRAFAKVANSDRRKVQLAYANQSTAGDQVVCDAAKILVSAALSAPPLDRAILVRALAMN